MPLRRLSRFSAFFLLVVLVVALSWFGWRASRPSPVTVGLVAFMSPGSAIGTSEMNAGELFREEHPTTRIQVVNAYEGVEPDEVVPAIETSLARGVRFFVTSHPSKHAVASLHLFEDGRALAINLASTSPALGGRDDFLLRIVPDALQEQRALAGFVGQWPGRRLLVLRDTGNPPYTEPALDAFGAALAEQGRWELVHHALAVRAFRPDDWQALMAEPFDGLYILAGTFQNAIGNIAQLFHLHHPEAPILLTPWARSPTILETAGAAVERIVLPSVYPPRQADPRIDAYLTRFAGRFGYPPSALTIGVRQALELLDAAFAAGHDTPETVKRYLLSRPAHETSLGPIAFDACGDVVGDYAFIQDPRQELR